VDKPLLTPFFHSQDQKGLFIGKSLKALKKELSHLYASNAGFSMNRKLGPRLTLQNDMFWKD
jgi:hypothetical protein